MATPVQSASMQSWRAPTAPETRNYPYNCWWVAAFSDEVGQDFLDRWLLETPILLYRKENGEAVALENRCPHRGAPLSLGCRKGDAVQCGYHGFTFNPDGSNAVVPSMRGPLGAARVRAFPVIEQAPYIWIYLGDPEKIDDVPPPPKLDWAEDSSFAEVHGHMAINANYMLLKENVLDLTHFGYVHAKSFGITDWVDPPAFSFDDKTSTYHQSFKSSPLPFPFAVPMNLAVGTPYDRENYGSFLSPALQVAAVDLIEPESKKITGRFRIVHATTPVDNRRMHYFWIGARDYGTSAEEMEALANLTKVGFAEDEEMIEAIQATFDQDPRGSSAPEISVKMDTAGIQARRIVKRWMERESL